MRRPRAFTLVELTVVLLTMALFAAMVLPAVSHAARGTGLSTTRDKLRDLLEFARASAVSRKRPVTVNVAPQRRRVWVTLQTTALPWIDKEQPPTRVLAAMEIPEKLRIEVEYLADDPPAASTDWHRVRFASDGRAPDVRLALVDPSQRRLAVRVTSASGRVRVEEP